VYGRLPVYIGTIFLATIFEIACAVAPNAPALLVLRFIAGLVSSAPLSNAGGTLNDIGTNVSRTLMFSFFSGCGFIGPVLAPLIGGYIVENDHYGWRWCYWVTAIWNALAFLLVGCFMPETLAPALLRLKAKKLRSTTGQRGWRAKVEDESLKEATIKALARPFKMLAVEPVVQFFVFYLTSMF
jgi:DHA1 family multidrug resistance protein-like MFS transporter